MSFNDFQDLRMTFFYNITLFCLVNNLIKRIADIIPLHSGEGYIAGT